MVFLSFLLSLAGAVGSVALLHCCVYGKEVCVESEAVGLVLIVTLRCVNLFARTVDLWFVASS